MFLKILLLSDSVYLEVGTRETFVPIHIKSYNNACILLLNIFFCNH